jgi:hypothetical protein
MVRFHGVATHYLRNYLGWRRMLERYGKGVNIKACLHEALGHPMQHVIGTEPKKSETNQQVSDFHTSEGAVNGSLTDRH